MFFGKLDWLQVVQLGMYLGGIAATLTSLTYLVKSWGSQVKRSERIYSILMGIAMLDMGVAFLVAAKGVVPFRIDLLHRGAFILGCGGLVLAYDYLLIVLRRNMAEDRVKPTGMIGSSFMAAVGAFMASYGSYDNFRWGCMCIGVGGIIMGLAYLISWSTDDSRVDTVYVLGLAISAMIAALGFFILGGAHSIGNGVLIWSIFVALGGLGTVLTYGVLSVLHRKDRKESGAKQAAISVAALLASVAVLFIGNGLYQTLR